MIRATVLTLALALPAHAQTDPAAMAENAAGQLRVAAAGLNVADNGYGRIAALTKVIRAYEDGLAAMRASLRAARDRESQVTERLATDTAQVGAVLNALTAMGQAPEAMLLLHPSGPTATARAGMLMRDVTPAMLSRVEDLRRDLQEVSTMRGLQDSALVDLEQGLSEWQDARARLAAAIEARSDLPRRATEDPATMERLAANAQTLSDFAQSLSTLPPDALADSLPAFAEARGQLGLPVPGRLARAYQETDAAGIARPGWVIDTAPGTLVTTPWAGTIRYLGPLLDYKNVMILEPEPGYLMVFAGMADVYGATGEVLPAGAPIGIMGGSVDAEMAGFQPDGAETGGQRLYVEIRHDRSPQDPAEWFVLDQG
ncbi:Peptidase family M23 [Rhodobacteraceae bacterium THAF1]|uniref:murein hydrolase activator EnvC family protein n=1 Tax=Palleronia sp. THAF1 TaxID=2587842 RepID=UPI000F412768|nr:peptidoglycan DD-metalloendopeptidase family protein [Palleronia sp. THAF1]QFU10196.1 Peptidase family M23 [Palleronia sp. THAF1]VDC16899.1 Peptidase family M23 [Rhodobacteraceae bacterium THAF1]